MWQAFNQGNIILADCFLLDQDPIKCKTHYNSAVSFGGAAFGGVGFNGLILAKSLLK